MSRRHTIQYATVADQDYEVKFIGYPNSAALCDQDWCIEKVEIESLKILNVPVKPEDLPTELQTAFMQLSDDAEWSNPYL